MIAIRLEVVFDAYESTEGVAKYDGIVGFVLFYDI